MISAVCSLSSFLDDDDLPVTRPHSSCAGIGSFYQDGWGGPRRQARTRRHGSKTSFNRILLRKSPRLRQLRVLVGSPLRRGYKPWARDTDSTLNEPRRGAAGGGGGPGSLMIYSLGLSSSDPQSVVNRAEGRFRAALRTTRTPLHGCIRRCSGLLWRRAVVSRCS